MNKKYCFVKIGQINGNDGTWYFSPNNVEQIKEHWEKYPASIIREGSHFIAKRVFNNEIESTTENPFVMAVDKLNQVTCNNIMLDMAQVEMMAYNNRISDFERGRRIFLPKNLTVVTLDERFYEIKKISNRDKLTFPDEDKPSLDDVRYIQWDGGEHWYAKIGKLDIIDENNNQKWNSKEDAKKAAEWYIEKNW